MSHWALRAGLVCLVAGILGAVSAVALLVWPPQVDESLLSYPFTETGFLVAQGWFAVHHLGLVAGVVALALSGAVGSGRVARTGAWLLAAGTVMLTGTEVLAMRYSDWTNDAANAGLLGTSYGVSCTVMGLGAILAGWGVLRTRSWTGWRAWTPMVIGVAEFVMLTPGLFGGFVIARIVIGTWMLMFAALGWSLYAQAHALTPQSANSGVGVHASPASAQAAAAPETRRSATLQSLLPQGRSPIRRRPAAKTGHHER